MTAEVAVLNKHGVALAADSTVTIGEDKTYDTANKLFTLSKYEPVGILIYNAMDLTTIPMEILIKGFRDRLGNKKMPHLADYSKSFVGHLKRSLKPNKREEEKNVQKIVYDLCANIYEQVQKACKDQSFSMNDPAKLANIKKIFLGEINEFATSVRSAGKYKPLQHLTETKLISLYSKVIKGGIKARFGSFDLKPKENKLLESVLARSILSNRLSRYFTGFAIAGYGTDDIYPRLTRFRTDGCIAGTLKIISGKLVEINTDNSAGIYPFAQRDVSELFIEGVDRSYQAYINHGITSVLSNIAPSIIKYFNVTNKKRIKSFKDELSKLEKAFKSDLNQYRRRSSIEPVLDAVQHLGKSELAILAESLVSITALKRKISLDVETVGGPVDVAVVSKNDGFIWIKRKHYFAPELNPFFIKKYLKEEA